MSFKILNNIVLDIHLRFVIFDLNHYMNPFQNRGTLV